MIKRIHAISDWRTPTVIERKERLKSFENNLEIKISMGEFAVNFSTFDFYSYLKTRFGYPNGFIMDLKNPKTSDNLIHWGFDLLDNEYYVRIFGMKSYVQIFYAGEASFSNKDWELFLSDLKNEFKRYKIETQPIKNSFEEWDLTFNPYNRINHRTLMLEATIKHIRSVMSSLKNHKDVEKGLKNSENFIPQFNEFCDACFFLNLLIPLKGEAFVNAIMFLLVRSEIKEDQNLYDRLIRMNIDIKIKLLHVHCFGFKKQPDWNHSAFKNFMKIYAKRNDSIHGNFLPNQHTYGTVYFDDMIPLSKKNELPLKSLFAKHLKGIEPDSMLNNLENVRKFQEFILECIDETIKSDLLHMLKQDELGWDKKRKRLGILFPIQEGYISTYACEGIYRDWEDDFSKIFL